MRVRGLRTVAASLLAAGLAAAPALSQTTGAIDGIVLDSIGKPLPGATVEISSPALQGIRQMVTDVDGLFRFRELPLGTYTVAVRFQAVREERTGIKVTLDRTPSVEIEMPVSGVQEVEVTEKAPIVETSSAAAGLTIRGDIAQRLPTSRNYAAVVAINPGVANDNADTQGRAVAFTIYGATSVENQFLVDGANTTNVIRGFQGKALSQEFIEEVQVKASGYEAEYGRAMGGVVNVVTKSGGNEFHGDAFGYFDRKGLTADPKGSPSTDASYIDVSQRNREDFGADLGGYVLEDRLWFFGAYNRVAEHVDQTPNTGPNAGRAFPIDFGANIYSGKLTARASGSTTLVATVYGDPEKRDGTIANFTASDPAVRQGNRDIGALDFSLSATQLFGALGLVKARFSQHRDRYELTGQAGGVAVRDFRDSYTNPTVSGGFGSVLGAKDDNRSRRNSVKVDGTLFLAEHEVKVGLDYESNRTTSTDFYTGGQQLSIRPCPPPACAGAPEGQSFFYQHDFYATSSTDPVGTYISGATTVEPRIYRLGLFAQDSWKVIDNVTVNAGLRYDQEDIRDRAGNKIFNASGEKLKLTGEWQPRIGVAWDVSGDGSSKVSASYGRFYYALPTDLAVRAYPAKVQMTTFNYDPGSLAQDPDAPRRRLAQGGLEHEPFQNDLGGIYQDELTAGLEKAIDPTLGISARFVYRNLGRVIEDRCDLDSAYPEANGNTCVLINPGSDSPFATGQGIHTCDGRDWPTLEPASPGSACTGPSLTGASVPDARRTYYAVEVLGKKRLGTRLWVQTSYIWQRLRGNYDGEARLGSRTDPGGGQTDPGINADYDYPLFLANAGGKLVLDRTHTGRLDGTYTAPFGLTVGFGAFVRTGAPKSRVGYFNTRYGAELFFVPRGSEGRQPTEYDLNLSLAYGLKIEPVTVTFFAQGFNLLNRQTVLGTVQEFTIAPFSEPGSINPDYGKVAGSVRPDGHARSDPRTVRLGARVSF